MNAEITTRIGMPLEEFIQRFDSEGPFELIDGEYKKRTPTVLRHSKLIRLLFQLLLAHTAETGSGEVFNDTTFVMPGAGRDWVKGSRIPDLMFYAGQRMAEYENSMPDALDLPVMLVPDLVIEVVSPTDKYSEIGEKVEAYLRDGVRLIWVFDPQQRNVTVHAPDLENPIVLKADAILDGGKVIPGFRIPLKEVFV